MEREDSWTTSARSTQRLRDSETLPTTSQPSVGDFEAVYEPELEAGQDIVSIHIASGISGTCDSAREAARSLAARGSAGRIEVVDGQTGAGGLGCVVLAAGELPPDSAPTPTRSSPRPAAPASRWRCGSASTRSSTCAAEAGSVRPRPCSARR